MSLNHHVLSHHHPRQVGQQEVKIKKQESLCYFTHLASHDSDGWQRLLKTSDCTFTAIVTKGSTRPLNPIHKSNHIVHIDLKFHSASAQSWRSPTTISVSNACITYNTSTRPFEHAEKDISTQFKEAQPKSLRPRQIIVPNKSPQKEKTILLKSNSKIEQRNS